ncbi:unnamed protein product, partial [Adineta steineri]
MSNEDNEMTSLLPNTTYEQQQQQEKKKKKCRGNRKIQRYRRQLYGQGLDSDTVNKLVEERLHVSEQQQQQQQDQAATSSKTDTTQNLKVYIPLDRVTLPNLSRSTSIDSIEMTPKRKRFLLTPTPTVETRTILDKPLSQLSISNRNPKKKKTTTTITTTTNPQLNDNNDDLLVNSSENYKPSYLKVSDRIFKQLLSNSIDNGHETISCLDTNEKLHFVRQMTEITNNLYFKDLQRQLWLEYYNSSIEDDNWESKITNRYAHQHNTCRMYKPKKSLIEQRQIKVARQIQEIGSELQDYLIK